MDKTSSPTDPYVAIAPGRVNLLGEHVDYNDGIVLPVAIDRQVTLSFAPIEDPVLHLHALDFDQQISISLEKLEEKCDVNGEPLSSFALYPAGVAWALQQANLAVIGMQAAYSSNIPIGAGLSSSAAVEVAFAVAWQMLGGWQIPRMQLAQLCQLAENEYIGVQSGLMDQFASLFGVEQHALKFDTRSLVWAPIPLPENTAIVIADSQVRRTLAGSAYNERRNDCEIAVAILNNHLPEIKALRDVTPDDFNRYADNLPERVQKRARFVVEECARVEKAITYLQNGEAGEFGRMMFSCHEGLRDLYQVSHPELDNLVENASHLPGCLGARLTGAGFGGCTINLVEDLYVEKFIAGLSRTFTARTGKPAKVYHCHATNGASVQLQDA